MLQSFSFLFIHKLLWNIHNWKSKNKSYKGINAITWPAWIEKGNLILTDQLFPPSAGLLLCQWSEAGIYRLMLVCTWLLIYDKLTCLECLMILGIEFLLEEGRKIVASFTLFIFSSKNLPHNGKRNTAITNTLTVYLCWYFHISFPSFLCIFMLLACLVQKYMFVCSLKRNKNIKLSRVFFEKNITLADILRYIHKYEIYLWIWS